MQSKQRYYVTAIFLMTLVFLLGACNGTPKPIAPPDAPQVRDDPLANLKIAVIEAKALSLAAYRSIVQNREAGMWTEEFAAKVYTAADRLERAADGVQAALDLGNVDDAQAQLDALSTLMTELKNLITPGEQAHENRSDRGADRQAIRSHQPWREYWREFGPDPGQGETDDHGRSATIIRAALDRVRNQTGQGRGGASGWHANGGSFEFGIG